MRILCIGDVVGDPGCGFLLERLPQLKKYYRTDYVVVNGENSHTQNGIGIKSAEQIFTAGADVITTGNHVFKRREIYDLLDENPYILRPANYGEACPGKGICVIDDVRSPVCVINIMGTVFMENLSNPFHMMDELLKKVEQKIILVDFHAEATSEKVALATYLDGRVSAVVGTHTHVQTADERILPGGTGFMTDLGMTGPKQSSLGVRLDQVIGKYLNHMPTRYTVADGPCILCGLFLEIDGATGKTIGLERVQVE